MKKGMIQQPNTILREGEGERGKSLLTSLAQTNSQVNAVKHRSGVCVLPKHDAESADQPGEGAAVIHHSGLDPLSAVLTRGHGGDVTQVTRTNHNLG